MTDIIKTPYFFREKACDIYLQRLKLELHYKFQFRVWNTRQIGQLLFWCYFAGLFDAYSIVDILELISRFSRKLFSFLPCTRRNLKLYVNKI